MKSQLAANSIASWVAVCHRSAHEAYSGKLLQALDAASHTELKDVNTGGVQVKSCSFWAGVMGGGQHRGDCTAVGTGRGVRGLAHGGSGAALEG